MKKILLLLVLSAALYILWLFGLEKIYAHILFEGASLLLSPFSNITPILKAELTHPDFCVAVGKEGYCMQLELFGLSILLLLAWFIMRLIFSPKRRTLIRALSTLLLFYTLQILVMCSLSLYDLSPIIQQINNALRQSFAIIALVIILFDSYVYRDR